MRYQSRKDIVSNLVYDTIKKKQIINLETYEE